MSCKFAAVAAITACLVGGISASGVDTACETSGVCTSPLNKDQILLQTKQSASTKVACGVSGSCGPISRRRRQQSMTACRRRHSALGYHDTDEPGDSWKCDEVANEMRCVGGSAVACPCQTSSSTTSPPEIVDDENDNDPENDDLGASGSKPILGYPSSGSRKSRGLWCEVDIPPSDWELKSCPSQGDTDVKVLTYNLFWWNLFNQHGGGDKSAGRLIDRTSSNSAYDIMGFQECEDVGRVLRDAGMKDEYATIDGGSAIAVAYRKSRWTELDKGTEYVGEDSKDQYYGKRRAQWVRLRNKEGKVVFFVNHHGPLRVSQGGGCTGSTTTLNIMRVIGENAREGDVVILVGDFNAEPHSSRIVEMKKRIGHVYSGRSMGGVDHIFSNCASGASGKNLGKGDGSRGSDHDALSAKFKI